jgi:formylglycine-generating enzyme required for sulfatase activity
MSGNVYEWVADWYSSDYYSNSPYKNPTGPKSSGASTPRRVVRGGNLSWDAAYSSIAFHDWWEPGESNFDVGFRCVVVDNQ